jgi:N-formylglutamate amidohydrolase
VDETADKPPIRAPDDELGRTIQLLDATESSPVVLHAPHAGRTFPVSCLGAFTISREQLGREHRLLADHATDRIAMLAGAGSQISAGLSRLIVDVERFEGDAEEMNAVGMGVLYTHGADRQPIRTLDNAERERLLAHFRVYGELFADLVGRALEEHGRAIVLDVHSFGVEPLPYELHGADRRPHLCIGVDDVHTPPALVETVRAAFDGWEIAVNEPFRGTYVPLRQLGDPRVSSVMLEIRRDRYLRSDGSTDDDAVHDIGRRLRRIVAEVSRV